MGIQALQNATGPRELHWIDGASHNDLYYKEQYVGPAVTKGKSLKVIRILRPGGRFFTPTRMCEADLW